MCWLRAWQCHDDGFGGSSPLIRRTKSDYDVGELIAGRDITIEIHLLAAGADSGDSLAFTAVLAPKQRVHDYITRSRGRPLAPNACRSVPEARRA